MALATAFADPVHEAQTCFRAVMSALARPGTIQPVAGLADAPAPLSSVAAAIVLTLADYETSVFLDAPLAANAEVARYVAFHTGAKIVTAPSLASFAVIADPLALPDFAEFALGTDTYPDRSTTLIVQVASLGSDPASLGTVAGTPLPPRSGGKGSGVGAHEPHSSTPPTLTLPTAARGEGIRASLRATGGGASQQSLVLSGPGIKGTAILAAAGLPADILERLAANRALFPRGIDLILAGPDAVAALPRTTRVSAQEA